jgi:hypothetical protein
MMYTKFVEWPTGGPDHWLQEWQKLMTDCETWNKSLYDSWASDFKLVWGEVPDA